MADASTTLPAALPHDPLPMLGAWLDRARDELSEHNPWAMTLATAGADGDPSARLVLCRGYDASEGWLVFYTDRNSRKGVQLGERPRAAAVFYWDPLHLQVRIEGGIVHSPETESDAYFASRPPGAQVAAAASLQSEPIESRDALVAKTREEAERLGAPPAIVSRPLRWGGYRLWIDSLEFWVGQPDRLHDRALYTRRLEPTGAAFRAGAWRAIRLQP